MEYSNIYFIGIGGIGMSSLARYFLHENKRVGGYDRTETPLTKAIKSEGAEVKYDDCVDTINEAFKNKDNTLIVYTPAIPSSHSELNYFIDNGFNVVKRSQILGILSKDKYLMAVAGTHGKTSTTTMLAWFNSCAATNEDGQIGGGSAFLGGISKNYDSNMVLGRGDRLSVEADEFDRSFLQLYPNVAIITSVDADHLDIYNDHETLKQTFTQFTSQIKPGGTLVYRYGIDLTINNDKITCYTYSCDDTRSDFYAKDLRCDNKGCYTFSIVTPDCVIDNIRLGIPGRINIENCVGALSLMWVTGFDKQKFIGAADSFRGVKRRFDFYINTPSLIYMDDYAHHPSELRATLESIKAMFPNRKITAIFQPHLYTRTRDFADGFAESLSLADQVILLPIYPAREEPIEGIESDIIFNKITSSEKQLIAKPNLVNAILNSHSDIFITFGAGDIDMFCTQIAEKLINYKTT